MEKGQSEVTNKIRSAIKKKLSEISDFVDDELPEYIMILVANQKSKNQIKKDLSLFLRNETDDFTNWLWDLLNNMKIGFKSSNSSAPKNDSNQSKRREIDVDEDAVVLDCDPDEEDGDFLIHEDTSDSSVSKIMLPEVNLKSHKETIKELLEIKSPNNKVDKKDKIEIKLLETSQKILLNSSSKEPLSSAVVPVKKQINSDDEYDPTKPECNSYSPKRHRFRRLPDLQTNKLLLKAVDDATKSVLEGKSIEDFYKPTPIKVLTSKQSRNPIPRLKGSSLSKMITCHHDSLESKFDSAEKSACNDQEFVSDVCDGDNYVNDPSASHRSRTICLRPIPLISDAISEANETCTSKTSCRSLSPTEDVRPKSPHFIVTLEGVNLASFKRKHEECYSDNMEDEDMDTDESPLNDTDIDTPPEKKLKLNERCKYWPACKNSDHCSYHHPTVPCKCFPDCKFGDKCLYIHPNCKFDALCSRKDCPYTHASKRKLALTVVPIKMVPVKTRKPKSVCKFYPKCFTKNCPFIHPKLCRYGTDCRLPMCLFGHFPVPSRSQMKWQASIS